ncbi:Gfo/Idh/MocA family protein [Brevifollis gellanilyticus]|uniref:Oxidoreductase n=1 Tax=Brevifollis gellanilyticus TaxID=748831 RepID=A0A512MI74_9BACT|nr:Gfo/Idh/MocA family oxidoreductase [Brevifollis gellanilyticus]GEP46437.1 oxidoreductase [Brevifollis gellanilyticus]
MPLNTRRHFLIGAASAMAMQRSLKAQSKPTTRLRFAVIGINHEHIFRMVKALRDGGGELAMIYDPYPDPTHGTQFLKENLSVKRARAEREVLNAPDIQLVVSAALPSKRAQLGIRTMRAGKDFLADKGGFLNLEDLEEARRVQAETKRIFAISYNERLLLPVSLKIDELLRAGAIGKVTHMWGYGPHGLYGHGPREPWFWLRAARGGILNDIGAHQADQFIHYLGADGARVLGSYAGNFENPDHTEFEDFGRVWFQSAGGTGESMLSYTKAKTTGFQLHLYGTEGRLEVFKSSGRISLVKPDGSRREFTVPSSTPCPWGTHLVDDILHRTETAMPQSHTFLASELAVRAHMVAVK